MTTRMVKTRYGDLIIGETGSAMRGNYGLLKASAAGIVLSVGVALVLYGPHPLTWLYAMSWQVRDWTWMPKGQHPHPVLGDHYFGDWQLYVGWARDPHPYFGHRFNFNGMPPALWLLRAVDGLSFGASYALSVAVGLGLTGAATWLLTKGHPWWARVGAYAVFLLGSFGFIFNTDRGNLQVIAVGLLGLWVWVIRSRRPWWAALLLALAICFKPYLAVLLLWPLALRAWRTLAATIILVAVPSAIGFLAEPGPVMSSIHGYREMSKVYTAHSDYSDGLMWAGPSALSVLIHPLTLVGGPYRSFTTLTDMPAWVLLVPCTAYLVLVAYAALARRLSSPLLLCLVLSLSQMLLPGGQMYTMVWCWLGAVVLMSAPRPRSERTARVAVEVALLMSILPLPVTFGGVFDFPLATLLSPLAWVVAAGCAAVATFRLSRRTELDGEIETGGEVIRASAAYL